MENNLIFVKLGGSLITEKSVPATLKYSILKRIVKELKEVVDRERDLNLLIGHGGGSFPHPIAKAFRTSEGFIQADSVRGFAMCQNAASTLNRVVVDLMTDYGINAVSIQPSACCIAEDGEIVDFFIRPIEECMSKGLYNYFIPVIHFRVLDTSSSQILPSIQPLQYLLCNIPL